MRYSRRGQNAPTSKLVFEQFAPTERISSLTSAGRTAVRGRILLFFRSAVALQLESIGGGLRTLQFYPSLGLGRRQRAIVHYPDQFLEGLEDVLPALGAGFQHLHPELDAELLRFLAGDLATGVQVALVPDEEFREVVRGRVVVELGHPAFAEALEGFGVGDVVHQDHALGFPEVGREQHSREAFLPRGVPYLRS